jgi:PAS domain S-box-containing protein
VTVSGHHLLLVDDDETNLDLLGRRLVRSGYSVHTTTSGQEALDYLENHRVSTVLLDVQMPGMSGLEVLQVIRRRWSETQLPVLMVTAKAESEDTVTALDLGASDYLTKPIDFRVALARVRTQLSRKDAEDRLRASAERYALAAQGANDGLWDWDLSTGRLYYSSRWKAIIGHDDAEIGDEVNEWFDRVHSEDLPRLRHELDEHLAGRPGHFECEHRIRHKSGKFRWVLTRGLAVRDGDGRPTRMAGSQSDVTDGKVVDALTGLPNRVLLVDRLERMLARRRKPGTGYLAVLFLDLDGFKLINDGMGHIFGDQLLQAVATRLKQCLRVTDTVARPQDGPAADGVAREHTIGRLGGDEFVVLLHDVAGVVEATMVAERLRRALAAPFELDGRQAFISASIGIALDSTSYSRGEDILRDADTAMYRAKALGKGRFEVFDSAMRERVIARMQMETALRLAVERHEFVPFFQPIIDLRASTLTGFESLLRWQRPEQGLVLPGEFIAILQNNGLITQVGRRFFGDVCQVLKSWQDMHPGAPDLSVNVNFAGPQFNEVDLLDHLLEMLEDSGLHAGQLIVEITEATAISDFAHAAEVLKRIRDAGFRIVLDDFGTGFSSLSCLHELPITGIKLDRTFIANERRHPALLKGVVTLAGQLGLTVTAEGIETEHEYELLRDLGCTFGQGYLFGRPVDADATRLLLSQDRQWAPVLVGR